MDAKSIPFLIIWKHFMREKRLLGWRELNDELLSEAHSGLPIPLIGLDLHLAKNYAHRHGYKGLMDDDDDADAFRKALKLPPKPPQDEWVQHNSWYSKRLGGNRIVLFKNLKTGKVRHMIRSHLMDRLQFMASTEAASSAWKLETEEVAIKKLKTLLSRHSFERYMLLGQFWEKSKRSGLHYIFRRSRPTLAIRLGKEGQINVLAALCVHPIGYYQSTWAGVMVPTDEVVAHLLLMRGDEHRFWKKSNHHTLEDPATGI